MMVCSYNRYAISDIGPGLIPPHRQQLVREGRGEPLVHLPILVDPYASVQLHPPFEAPLRLAGRGCRVRRRRDVVLRPTAGCYAPALDAFAADGHMALAAYPSVQLHLPYEAPLHTAGRGCRAWRRRDVERLSVEKALVSAYGELAVPPRAIDDPPVAVRNVRPAVSTYSHPYVQLHPLFEAPLLFAGRGCLAWRRRYVVQLLEHVARNGIGGYAAAGINSGINADFLAPPNGCRGTWLPVRNDDDPFVQLYPPSEAPLRIARRGCREWRRRDVARLTTWWACALGCGAARPGLVAADCFPRTYCYSLRFSEVAQVYPSAQLYPPGEAPQLSARCGCRVRRRRDVGHLAACAASTVDPGSVGAIATAPLTTLLGDDPRSPIYVLTEAPQTTAGTSNLHPCVGHRISPPLFGAAYLSEVILQRTGRWAAPNIARRSDLAAWQCCRSWPLSWPLSS